jgi:hypothetical protein
MASFGSARKDSVNCGVQKSLLYERKSPTSIRVENGGFIASL